MVETIRPVNSENSRLPRWVFAFFLTFTLGICYAVFAAGEFVATCFQNFSIALRTNPPPVAHPPGAGAQDRTDPDDRDEPAYRHYLLGQVSADLRHTVAVIRSGLFRRWRQRLDGRIGRWRAEPDQPVLSAFGWALSFGLFAGYVLGGFVILAVFIVQFLVLGLLYVGLLIAIGCAWLGGMVWAWKKNVRCPWCGTKNVRPQYRCANTDCLAWHRDLRPGRYGVFSRVCRCGERLRTRPRRDRSSGRLPDEDGNHDGTRRSASGRRRSLRAGFDRSAICPSCHRPLADDVGTRKEIVLALLGDHRAGKTQLALCMITALQNMAQGDGYCEPADDNTKAWINVTQHELREFGAPRATPHLERAWSLYVGTRRLPQIRRWRRERLVHIFDPPGEWNRDRIKLTTLKYHRDVRTFIYVLDPRTIPAVRDRLPVDREEDARERDVLTGVGPADRLIGTMLTEFKRDGVPLHRSQLLVVVSKWDRIEPLAEDDGVAVDDSFQIERWLRDLGLEALLLDMQNHFRTVSFFGVSSDAWTNAELHAEPLMRVHPSVERFTQGLLGEHGLRFRVSREEEEEEYDDRQEGVFT